MSEQEKWDLVEQKVQALTVKCEGLVETCKNLDQKIILLEKEIQSARSIGTERDRLKTEREVVKRRVLEMLQQLEKLQL